MLVRQRNVTGATYHPELTDSVVLHETIFGIGNFGTFGSVGRKPTGPQREPPRSTLEHETMEQRS